MMNYSDIIRDNCANHSPVKWWPKFAFHYTDVTNAVSILHSGFLYSRADASHLRIMNNDNASRQVIDMTNSDVVSKVRFYFRPLTPTQYYNEGYKHPALRYDRDENANIPIPIFFLFDLESLLSVPGVQFSETTQAGHGSKLLSGEEAFSQLNFDYIYDNRLNNLTVTKAYRHAEIVYPNSMPIENHIKFILCRTDSERTTLLNLLYECNRLAYAKYKNIIKVSREDTFENNALFLSECLFHNNMISLAFCDSLQKVKYTKRMIEKFDIRELSPIKLKICITWFNSRNLVRHEIVEACIDYSNPKSYTFRGLPIVPQAHTIGIKVFLEDKLINYTIQSLDADELLV